MNQSQNQTKSTRGLGLCSGGLDSMLSALVLREQGLEVEWITFETPFFGAEKARLAAERLDIPLRVRNITPEYLELLKDPPCGFGKNMNPCMDCHALMFRLAGRIMEKEGFDFLFSGEVLGQRPFSQNKSALRYVEKHSGYQGYIIRPLSAKLLEPSLPEQRGLVDRQALLDISGRSRKRQITLARQWNITDYPSPAGGCLLTDPGYSARLGDLYQNGEHVNEAALELLKYGRHLRLNPQVKIIVGRTKAENEQIIRYYDADADFLLKVKKYPGPTVLMPGGGDEPSVMLAASICVGYSKAPDTLPVAVQLATPAGRKTVSVLGLGPSVARKFLIRTNK